jgi:DNA-directed DNA polymerase III PolC
VFVHLNTHSHYSLLQALPPPEDLAKAAANAGMPAIALTDRRMLSGVVEFFRACIKESIRPILGLEMDIQVQEEMAPLILLAEDMEGWTNLCRISSSIHLREEPDTPGSLDLIDGNSRGLIAISSFFNESSGKSLKQVAELFPNSLYAMVRDNDMTSMSHAYNLAKKVHLPPVAIHPISFIRADEAPLIRTLTAIDSNRTIQEVPDSPVASPRAFFLSPQEMEERYGSMPEAIEATMEIASRCRLNLPLGVAKMPGVGIPKGMKAVQYLRQRADKGLRKLYRPVSAVIQQRFDHELEVIAERGFEPIFLIVEELLNFARRQNIPFSSRGSAGSSLVAHCLGITSPDPIALDLYFERFLNPARTTPPDIDTDLDSRGRDAVIQHVFEKYGAERVAMVGTINRFRPRSALGDVSKAHGLSPDRAHELTRQLPYGFFARMEESEEEESGRIPESPFKDLARANSSPEFKRIFSEAEALLKQPRHLSVHAGGLVIAPGIMTDLVPVMRSGSKGVIITQFDLSSVEDMGLVKIDLLGIRGLTVMGDVAKAIYSWRRRDYTSPLAVLDSIPLKDEETSDRLEKGLTIGCFQIESPGMRATLREVHARKYEDLIVALSLYRPGPITGGMKDAFVRRFRGQEDVEYLHPALEPMLKETFGVILYQEQVLRLARDVAGMSLADGDLLRRAMSHFDPGKQMQLLKERFLHGAAEKNGVAPDVGEKIWELMAAFAGYGFPKAHAASYALVSWRSAWCKTHFPAEFMAGVLANWGGYYSQKVYLSEVRRLGIFLHGPDVNHSQDEFCVAYPKGEPALYMGLDQVKDCTQRTIQRIIQERPFRSLEEFLSKVDPRQGEAENLAMVGALEELGTIPQALKRLKGGTWTAGQMSLFEGPARDSEDWSIEQKVEAQKEILGVSVLAHPMDLVAEQVKKAGALSTVEAMERVGQQVTVAGVRMSSHRHRNSKGEWMAFVTLEDLEGMLETIILPDVYRKYKEEVFSSQPLLLSGTMEMDPSRGEPMLRVERLEILR